MMIFDQTVCRSEKIGFIVLAQVVNTNPNRFYLGISGQNDMSDLFNALARDRNNNSRGLRRLVPQLNIEYFFDVSTEHSILDLGLIMSKIRIFEPGIPDVHFKEIARRIKMAMPAYRSQLDDVLNRVSSSNHVEALEIITPGTALYEWARSTTLSLYVDSDDQSLIYDDGESSQDRLGQWTKHGNFSESTGDMLGITHKVEYSCRWVQDSIQSITLKHHSDKCFGLILKSDTHRFQQMLRNLEEIGIRTSLATTYRDNTLLFTSDYSEIPALLFILVKYAEFQASINEIIPALHQAVSDVIMRAPRHFLLSDPLRGANHEHEFLGYSNSAVAQIRQRYSRVNLQTNLIARQRVNSYLFQPYRNNYEAEDLQRVIQTSLQDSRPSVISTPTNLNSGANAKALEGTDIEVPEELKCPLSLEIMTKPTYVEGLETKQCFEFDFIKKVQDQSGVHPITRQSLFNKKLLVNGELGKKCADFVAKARAPKPDIPELAVPVLPLNTLIEVKKKRGCCAIM